MATHLSALRPILPSLRRPPPLHTQQPLLALRPFPRQNHGAGHAVSATQIGQDGQEDEQGPVGREAQAGREQDWERGDEVSKNIMTVKIVEWSCDGEKG